MRIAPAAIGFVVLFSAAFAGADAPTQRAKRTVDDGAVARAGRLATLLGEEGKKVEAAAKTDARYAATLKALEDAEGVRDDAERFRRAKGLAGAATAIRAAAIAKAGIDLNGLSAKTNAIFPTAAYVKPGLGGSKVELPKPIIKPAGWDLGGNCPVSDPSGPLAFTTWSSTKRKDCTVSRSMEAVLDLPNNKATRLEVTVPATLTSLSSIVALGVSASSRIEVGISFAAAEFNFFSSSAWHEEKECVAASFGHSAAATGFLPEISNVDKPLTLKCGLDLITGKRLLVSTWAFVRVSITRWNGSMVAVETKLNLQGFDFEGSNK